MRSWLSWLVIACALSCAVGPDYKRPEVVAPKMFRGASASNEVTPGSAEAESAADAPWWSVYGDPVLQALVREAVDKNFDLQIAAARVEYARAQARSAGAELLPELGVTGSLSYGQTSQQLALTTGSTGQPWIGTAGFSLNWEIDVWGRLRRLREAAIAGYHASLEDRRGVWITLLADIAQEYFNLRALDAQLLLSHRTVDSRSETLRLFVERLQGGVGSDVEVARAEANVAQVEAEIGVLKSRISQSENRISVLLGRSPGPIPREVTATPPKVPEVLGVPTKLLERRPDLRSAEQRLKAANAQIGAAKGQLYPAISLSGLLGLLTIDFDGSRALYGGGTGLNFIAPFLQGSQLLANIDATEALYEVARVGYLQAAVNAFREVSDGLAQRRGAMDYRKAQERRVASLERAVMLAQARYVGGVASYYELLDAQEQLFSAQTELVRAKANELFASVQLYRALGGGWADETLYRQ